MPTMWDRLRTHKDGLAAFHGDRRKQNSQQQDWQNPRSTSPYGYSFSIKGGPAPPRPPREFEYSTSPPDHPHTSAPAVQAPQYPPQAGRDSYRNSAYDRPVSSIYSQPSPAAATFAAQQLRHEVYSDPNEISPPSSPDALSPRDGPYSYTDVDVSPIEESDNRLFIMNQPELNQPADQSRSNIPMMRRERRKNSGAAFQTSKEMNSQTKQPRPHGSDVRWDPRTGEPTVGEKGRPSQINPHQYVQGLSAGKAPIGAPKQAGQQPISPFGVRLKPVTRKAGSTPKAEPAPKPEWRGGSGRTTLVEPVADDQSAAPLNIPRKSSKRSPRGPGVLSPVSSVGSETASPPPERVAPVKFDNSTSQPSTARNVAPSTLQVSTEKASEGDAQSYPSPPLSDDTAVPAKTPEQPRSQQQIPTPSTQSPISNTLFPPADKSIRRKPAGGAGHNPHVSTSSSVYSHQEVHQVPAAPVDDWVQPPSRFSVTTYATSAHTESPRPSVDDLPPMPTPPRQFTESPKSMPGGSILDRKRPIIGGYDGASHSQSSPPPIRINMELSSYKATSKSRPVGSRPVPPGNHSTLSVTSASSADKSLPLAPPELSARDRVAVLNAQIEALGNRRININHAIKQMTELMPTDNVLASQAVIQKRENEKRKVETLKTELADVQREEYELGLKLHRAYKRIDREAEYEPTTLWVRRITGRE